MRQAAGLALADKGPDGRTRLIRALDVEARACAAATALAVTAPNDPVVQDLLDPTTAEGPGGACVTAAFVKTGRGTHGRLMEALVSKEPLRARTAAHLACVVDPPLPEAVEQQVKAPRDQAERDRARTAMANLLQYPSKACGSRSDDAWRRRFQDKSTRAEAVAIVEGHSRRGQLLESRTRHRAACSGVDAQLLLIAGGEVPGDDELSVLSQRLDHRGKGPCPTVSTEPLVELLLAKGLAHGPPKRQRLRVKLLTQVEWVPQTDEQRVQLALITEDYAQAAEYGLAAAPAMVEALSAGDLKRRPRALLRAALIGLGPEVAPAIDVRIETAKLRSARVDLIELLQQVAGKRSVLPVHHAIHELEVAAAEGSGAIDGIQRRRLVEVIKRAKKASRAALYDACRKPGLPWLRAELFQLLVEVDGKRGKRAEAAAKGLLAADRELALLEVAAAYLAKKLPNWSRKRLKAGLKAGELSEGDTSLLAAMLVRSPRTMVKVVNRAKKYIFDAATLGRIAEKLTQIGAHAEAYAYATRAAAFLRKKGQGRSKEAWVIREIRDQAMIGLVDVATDPRFKKRKRVEALAGLEKAAESIRKVDGTVPDRLEEGLMREPSVWMRKQLRGTLKTLRALPVLKARPHEAAAMRY